MLGVARSMGSDTFMITDICRDSVIQDIYTLLPPATIDISIACTLFYFPECCVIGIMQDVAFTR